MEITGYQLREAIKRWTLKRDAIANQFGNSLHYFKGEDQPQPRQIVEEFLTAEKALAKVQTAQMEYNLSVFVVTKQLGTMTLAEAVKRVGGLGRVEKMWRSACGDRKDPYSMRTELTRNKDEERAQRSVSTETALKQATVTAATAGALRAAIAESNSTRKELKSLEPSLIED